MERASARAGAEDSQRGHCEVDFGYAVLKARAILIASLDGGLQSLNQLLLGFAIQA